MTMTKLWRTLDQWPGSAATRREWSEELGEEWTVAEAFLRPSGRRATELACPKSSENGCSRQIIELVDGRLRAECGDVPRRCNHIILERAEISVLELDRTRLAAALARAFGLVDAPDNVGREPVQYLGRYEISAGRGFPIFLVIPPAGFPLDLAALNEILAAASPKLVLTPTRTMLDRQAHTYLGKQQIVVMALQDILIAAETGDLATVQPTDVLFNAIISSFDAATREASAGPAISVPSGTKWPKVTIEFVELGIIRLTVAGASHRLGPDDLGLKNSKTQRPKAAWIFLLAMARERGTINRRGSKAADRSRIGKQKEAASTALRAFTGIPEDPISAAGDNYVAEYVTHADDLEQGRQSQTQRNFVGSG